MPLRACMPKSKKRVNKQCKHDFPKTRTCVGAPLLVCRGLAKRFGLRVSGKRNALGLTIGRRCCELQSGTTAAFAVLFRSNTHRMPNYRLPLLAETHEHDFCKSKTCLEQVGDPVHTKRVSKLAQRAQREATGYYCGYTFKT